MKILRFLSLIVLVLMVGSSLSVGIGLYQRSDKTASTVDNRVDDTQITKDVISTPWLSKSWNFRKRINISEAVGDYQMKLNVSYSGGGDISCGGHCNADFSDIRFTGSDGTSIRSYWIEEKVDKDYAITWISTSDEETMYLYYGNPDASSKSRGIKTFRFFDDFSRNPVDEYEKDSSWKGCPDSDDGYYRNTTKLNKRQVRFEVSMGYVEGDEYGTRQFIGIGPGEKTEGTSESGVYSGRHN